MASPYNIHPRQERPHYAFDSLHPRADIAPHPSIGILGCASSQVGRRAIGPPHLTAAPSNPLLYCPRCHDARTFGKIVPREAPPCRPPHRMRKAAPQARFYRKTGGTRSFPGNWRGGVARPSGSTASHSKNRVPESSGRVSWLSSRKSWVVPTSGSSQAAALSGLVSAVNSFTHLSVDSTVPTRSRWYHLTASAAQPYSEWRMMAISRE